MRKTSGHNVIDLTKLKPRECEQPLVSVIVPSYNVEEYIDQCLTSILNNGYQNIELLVIDDRSTDGTVDHIKALMKKDKRIQFFPNPEDHNIYGGACRNIGLDHARGKYVYFCDSDDYILPGLISECVRKCEKLNADVCIFKYRKLNAKDDIFYPGEYGYNTKLPPNSLEQAYSIEDCENIFKLTSPQVWSKFYNRGFIETIGGRFQELKNSNDCLFNIKTLAMANRIINSKSIYYVYRIGTKNSVQGEVKNDQNSKYTYDIFAAIKKSYEFVKEFRSQFISQFYDWVLNQLENCMTRFNIQDGDFIKYVKDWTRCFPESFRWKILDLFNIEVQKDNPIESNSFWNRFDKIVCIHYLPYKERFENIKKELKRVGILDLPQFEWYYTVDTDFYNYVLDGIPDDSINRDRVTPTNIKYTIDSYNLLRKLQFQHYNRVLIIEDDVAFHKDIGFIRKVVESTPEDFDVMNYDPEVLFRPNGRGGKFKWVNEHVQQYYDAKVVCTSCIAFSRKAVCQIVDCQRVLLQPFDIYTWNNVGDLKTMCVACDSHICIQDTEAYDTKQCQKTVCQKYARLDISKYNTVFPMASTEYDVVISCTSYKERLQTSDIYSFFNSLVNQKTNLKFHVALTLWKNDYWSVPQKMKDYFREHGIEVIVSEYNHKSHLKYIYAMQKYRNIPVITVDDDMVYRNDMVQLLWNDHKKNPRTIIFGRGRGIQYDKSGHVLDYNTWKDTLEHGQSLDIMPLGVGAVLYPSEFCKLVDMGIGDRIIDLDLLTRDDFMLHCLAQENGIKGKLVECKYKQVVPGGGLLVEHELLSMSRSENSLWKKNVSDNNKSIHLFDKGKKPSEEKYDVIVSLSTFSKRLQKDELIKCLDSLVHQKCNVKYHIVLNMWSKDYKYVSDKLKEYLSKNGIEVLLSEINLKTHQKYLLSSMKYKGTPVIVVDDDMVYHDDMVQTLCYTGKKHPDSLIFGLGVKYNGMICPRGRGGVLLPNKFIDQINVTKVAHWVQCQHENRKYDDDAFLNILARNTGISMFPVENQRKPGRNGVLVKQELNVSTDETSGLWKQTSEVKHEKKKSL